MSTINFYPDSTPNNREALNIGIVSETFPPEVNGVARTLERMVRGLSNRGHSVHIVRPDQGADDPREHDAADRITLVPGLPLPGYRGLRMGWPAKNLLQSIWKESPPDILYVATEGPLGGAAVSIAAKLGIPVISGFHTNFQSYSSHYRAGFLKPAIYRYLKNFHNRTALTLVPTRELQSELQDAGFNSVDVMGRGIDSVLFSPKQRVESLRRSWGVDPGDPVALYVGRIAAEKNLTLALEAYKSMQEINSRTRFVLVGDGPLRADLKARHPELIFCGTHTGQSLARHYASADIFLFPSETETFGNVTLEAMASGLALIAFDYAAVREVGERGVNGLYASLGDYEGFIAAATRLVAEPELVSRLGVNAVNAVVSQDWKSIIDRFEMLLFHHRKGGVSYARLQECNVSEAVE
jgi:glycosyltransferase involved in cell wall biosynthesis